MEENVSGCFFSEHIVEASYFINLFSSSVVGRELTSHGWCLW